MKQRPALDPWLTGYTAVMLAALSITSVGTFEFFAFILPWVLALAATVVLAAGIPLLKLGSQFDNAKKQGYLIWLVLFLGVELLAQYFKAQASFSKKVGEATSLAGSDLAAAAANWGASRFLAFLFLASLPFVVVAMCGLAADRWVAVRSRGVRSGLRRFAGIRAKFAKIRRMFVVARADLAAVRSELADIRPKFAATCADIAALRSENAQLDADLVLAHSDLAAARSEIVRRDGWLVEARGQLAELRSRPVLDVETAARFLIASGAPETTIRGWVTAGRVKQIEDVTQ